jgi:iron complex transport system substrate-binding protein
MASHEDTKPRRNIEELSSIVVDCGYRLHRETGPGLLDGVYEIVLAKLITDRGCTVRRQTGIPIQIMGLKFDEGFRTDLIVEDLLLVEIKSVEKLQPVHAKQTLTYLRLLNMPMALLLNFGAATFKEGCKRIVNGPQSFVSSRLRVNNQPEAQS